MGARRKIYTPKYRQEVAGLVSVCGQDVAGTVQSFGEVLSVGLQGVFVVDVSPRFQLVHDGRPADNE